ncbi:MAG: hypothetical protein IKT41_05500 [Clostridia bacterium]|nr:hypothetical protein [Clostridia bacterium]
MSRENFINNIKQPTPIAPNNLIEFVEMLSAKYPNCSISLEKVEKKHSEEKDDFILIKLKNVTQPIKFRVPAKKTDLSIYQTSPDYDTLNYRYDLYNTIYRDRIIKQFIEEKLFLQERFPNVVFNTKIRQKSKFSYEDKIIERMIENQYLSACSKKSYFIKDVIAGRHIISSIDGNTNPNVLTNLCYEFEQALQEFRTSKKGNDFNIVLKKDYITNPKENGYQSIHLINEDTTNPDCIYETQIRTFDMEEQSKNDEKIAHDTYKPRIIDQYAPLKVPIYTSITPFKDNNNALHIITLPPDEAFYHFYGIRFSEYMQQLNSINPIITDIKNHLHYKEQNKEKEIE